MNPNIKKFLYDIINASEDIEEFIGKLELEEFLQNKLVRAAVERKFEIIGEALNRIKKIDEAILSDVDDFQRIIGFRNVITHGYDVIDTEIVWHAAKDNVLKLKEQIKHLIGV